MNRFRVREIQCKRDDNNRGYYDSVDAIDDDPGHESRISRTVVLPTHAVRAEPFLLFVFVNTQEKAVSLSNTIAL